MRKYHPSTILNAAAALVRKSWIQRAYARDALGNACPASEGVSFCAMGAVTRAVEDAFDVKSEYGLGREAYSMLNELEAYLGERVRAEHGGMAITLWNDFINTRAEDVASLIEAEARRLSLLGR